MFGAYSIIHLHPSFREIQCVDSSTVDMLTGKLNNDPHNLTLVWFSNVIAQFFFACSKTVEKLGSQQSCLKPKTLLCSLHGGQLVPMPHSLQSRILCSALLLGAPCTWPGIARDRLACMPTKRVQPFHQVSSLHVERQDHHLPYQQQKNQPVLCFIIQMMKIYNTPRNSTVLAHLAGVLCLLGFSMNGICFSDFPASITWNKLFVIQTSLCQQIRQAHGTSLLSAFAQ